MSLYLEKRMSYVVTSLSPLHYDKIKDFFTKLKSLILQLKQCGIEKKEYQLILSILLKLGPEFSVFVSTFHSGKLTLRNWKISWSHSLKSRTNWSKWVPSRLKIKHYQWGFRIQQRASPSPRIQSCRTKRITKNPNPVRDLQIHQEKRRIKEKRRKNALISTRDGIQRAHA